MKKPSPFAGVAIGAVNGLFGAGGGMLCVPALTAQGLPQTRAQATTIAVILPLSILTTAAYLFHGSVDAHWWLVLLGALPGGWIGGKLLPRVGDVWLCRIFSASMVAAGVQMLLR